LVILISSYERNVTIQFGVQPRCVLKTMTVSFVSSITFLNVAAESFSVTWLHHEKS